MKYKYIFYSFLFAFGFVNCTAQTASPVILAVAGDNAFNNTCSLDWTLGELITETDACANNYLTQGFQQPSDIGVMATSNINNTNDNNISAYPNPSFGSVYIYNSANQQLRVEVLTLEGKTLFFKNLLGNTQNEIN